MFSAAAIVFALTSCHVNDTNDTPEEHTVSTTDTLVTTPVATVTETTTYTAANGDIMMKDGKLMEWKNGQWVAAEGDVTLDNGVIVSKAGVVKQQDKTVQLEEGEAVNRSGNFFDKAGHAISNAWDATKKGVGTAAEKTGEAVKDAGKAIGKGAAKVGEKAKEAVN